MDFIAPGSSVHGILQARILEWVVKAVWHGQKNYPKEKNKLLPKRREGNVTKNKTKQKKQQQQKM